LSTPPKQHKTLVIDAESGSQVPFLRGILTRSLQDAGLGFPYAYEVASQVRVELADVALISVDELRERVVSHLEGSVDPEVVRRYQAPSGGAASIMVLDAGKLDRPFSRGRLARCLQCVGLPVEDANAVTQKIYEHLLKRGVTEVSSNSLGYLTYRVLHSHLGSTVAGRYAVWVAFLRSGRPLILLMGGTTGCGKSTVATEVAHRLDIVRTQSTDMLREVMRLMVSDQLLPALHASSFNAWETLERRTDPDVDPGELFIEGYRTQSNLVTVAAEAVLRRARSERVSLIVEGVHIHPAFQERHSHAEDAIVVPLTLAVLKPEQLRAQLSGRAIDAPSRRGQRYLKHFDAIWQLQEYLLSEADRYGMPIIPNNEKEQTSDRVMRSIIDIIAQAISAEPKELFA
jgi:2-phosphoglycerate kinase